MNKETLAGKLNGHKYGSEIDQTDEAAAKQAGLVVVFGGSDDLMEFRGAINDEQGAPSTALVDAKGLLPEREQLDSDDDERLEDFFNRRKTASKIEAKWSDDRSEFTWSYQTDIPHATFDITDDDEKYCRGIVFALADLPSSQPKVDYDALEKLVTESKLQFTGDKANRDRVLDEFLKFARRKLNA